LYLAAEVSQGGEDESYILLAGRMFKTLVYLALKS
jgi:hypothetical protein